MLSKSPVGPKLGPKMFKKTFKKDPVRQVVVSSLSGVIDSSTRRFIHSSTHRVIDPSGHQGIMSSTYCVVDPSRRRRIGSPTRRGIKSSSRRVIDSPGRRVTGSIDRFFDMLLHRLMNRALLKRFLNILGPNLGPTGLLESISGLFLAPGGLSKGSWTQNADPRPQQHHHGHPWPAKRLPKGNFDSPPGVHFRSICRIIFCFKIRCVFQSNKRPTELQNGSQNGSQNEPKWCSEPGR